MTIRSIVIALMLMHLNYAYCMETFYSYVTLGWYKSKTEQKEQAQFQQNILQNQLMQHEPKQETTSQLIIKQENTVQKKKENKLFTHVKNMKNLAMGLRIGPWDFSYDIAFNPKNSKQAAITAMGNKSGVLVCDFFNVIADIPGSICDVQKLEFDPSGNLLAFKFVPKDSQEEEEFCAGMRIVHIPSKKYTDIIEPNVGYFDLSWSINKLAAITFIREKDFAHGVAVYKVDEDALIKEGSNYKPKKLYDVPRDNGFSWAKFDFSGKTLVTQSAIDQRQSRLVFRESETGKETASWKYNGGLGSMQWRPTDFGLLSVLIYGMNKLYLINSKGEGKDITLPVVKNNSYRQSKWAGTRLAVHSYQEADDTNPCIIKVYDMAKLDFSHTLEIKDHGIVWDIALSPNGKKLALIQNMILRLFDLSGQKPQELKSTALIWGGGTKVQWNNDGSLLATLQIGRNPRVEYFEVTDDNVVNLQQLSKTSDNQI